LDNRVYTEEAGLDGEVHRLSVEDDYTAFALCYPHPRCRELERRVEALLSDGFTSLVEYGRSILNYRVVGKGYASIAVLAWNKYYGLGLLKIRRLDSRRESFEYEGMILDYLDKTGYTPTLYLWHRDYIFMEYLHRCIGIDKALDQCIEGRDRECLKKIVKRTVRALYLFDKLGVDHGELNRPYEHILWCSGEVKVIDWESSRLRSKCHNLTSFISYLVYRYRFRREAMELLGIELEEVIHTLRLYKKSPSIKYVLQLLGD